MIRRPIARSYVRPMRELLAHAARIGFKVKIQRSCYDAETPFHIAGKTCPERKIIWIATHDYGVLRSEHELRCILSHEIEHASGKLRATNYPEYGLNCGGHYVQPEKNKPATKPGSLSWAAFNAVRSMGLKRSRAPYRRKR